MMTELNSYDFQQLSQCLAQLYLPCLLKDFPDRVMNLLEQMVSSEGGVCQSFNEYGATLLANTLPVGNFTLTPEKIPLQYLCQEPLVHNLLQNNRWDACKISDFVTADELRRNEAFYEMIYADNDIHDGITISIHENSQQPDLRQLSFQGNYANNLKRFPWDRHSWQTQKTLGNLFFVLTRSNENFTERDRAMLNLFRPHLLNAYHNVLYYTELQRQLAQLTQVTEQFGTILLSADGYIEYISDRAASILQCHFATERIGSTQLPDMLHSWVKQQIQAFNAASASQLLKPLQLKTSEQILSIRLFKDSSRQQWILTCAESTNKPLSLDSFCSMGLTKRESEVMFWIVRGLSNTQIATQLFCSDKTVKKHLEHIYTKLKVQSRSMAVAIVLSQLRS